MLGFVFPDFGKLDAFKNLDKVLHNISGVNGLSIWFLSKFK